MEYNPGCAKCRDEAGKDRAGIIDSSLCVPHLRSRIAELEALVLQEQGFKEQAYAVLTELEAERYQHKKSSYVLGLFLKHFRYDAYHQVYMINEIDLDADDKFGLVKAALRREGSDG